MSVLIEYLSMIDPCRVGALAAHGRELGKPDARLRTALGIESARHDPEIDFRLAPAAAVMVAVLGGLDGHDGCDQRGEHQCTLAFRHTNRVDSQQNRPSSSQFQIRLTR